MMIFFSGLSWKVFRRVHFFVSAYFHFKDPSTKRGAFINFVIIDCSEFILIRLQVLMKEVKHKFLVAVAPCGGICIGGRNSGKVLTQKSGFLYFD